MTVPHDDMQGMQGINVLDLEPAMFPIVDRMCRKPLLEMMRTNDVFMTGAGAMMTYLTADNFMRFMKNRRGVKNNFELRVPLHNLVQFGTDLTSALNKAVLHPFDATPEVAQCFLYMVEHMLLRAYLAKPEFHRSVLTVDSTPPDSLFVLTINGSHAKVCMQVHDKELHFEEDNTWTELTGNDAYEVIDILGLDENVWFNESTLMNQDLQHTYGNAARGFSSQGLKVASRDYIESEMQDAGNNIGLQLLSNTLIQDEDPASSEVLATYDSKENDLDHDSLDEMHLEIEILFGETKIHLGIPPPHRKCNTMIDVIFGYTASSSRYNVECMIAKYMFRNISSGSIRATCFPEAGVPYEDMTKALRCAASLAPSAYLSLGSSFVPATFTVYRAVDYFQPVMENWDMYTANLPFRIKNFTVCSTSASEERARKFLKDTCCMLVLTVPESFSRYIAIGNNPFLSRYPTELEILFPDDCTFVIDARAIQTFEQPIDSKKPLGPTRTVSVLKLFGTVVNSTLSMFDKIGREPCEGLLHCIPRQSQTGAGPSVMAHTSTHTRAIARAFPGAATRPGSHMVVPRALPPKMNVRAPVARPWLERPSTQTSARSQRPMMTEMDEASHGPVLDLVDLSCFGRPSTSCSKSMCSIGREQDQALREVFMRILGISSTSNNSHNAPTSQATKGGKSSHLLKADLMKTAARLGVVGRSRMRKDDLMRAIKKYTGVIKRKKKQRKSLD